MKKLVLISLFCLLTMLGVSVAAACVGTGDADSTPGFRQITGTARSEDLISAVPSQSSQAEEALFPSSAFGDSAAAVSRSGSGPRPLSARLVLSGFELVRLLSQLALARDAFLPAPDAAPQVLLWLASHLEVRAGPLIV